ncbi:hypothetical protein TCAL_09539 [Tigriopus californicus]|uniref:Apple domain-containing protein n=2 Tax=Tigriopus californicus TaxID=6832 RepID=A0A553P2U7_TIGCA|nr:hypothetical protein TCAL_09539 [Tigriopus californicus]|eukprot:TCALIF_09539-PA protein Name:"Protein of unknown function" AED:0.00 eAED:0.00 QI:18/1/1/1/1/0.75/4/49/474
MHANIVLLGLFFWFHNAVAQKGLQCFVPGECLDSQILGATPTNSSRECWRHCQSVTGCTWFTFYKDSQVCTSLSGCLRLSNEKCQDNCLSGEEECPEVQCGIHGRCYGALEGIRKVANARECASMCRHRDECFWNTYDPEHESCLMTNDCPVLDRSCSNCSSSERDCVAEIDASMNTPNEDNPKERPIVLMGADATFTQYYYNLYTQTTDKCELPPCAYSYFVQYTEVDNDFLGCAKGSINGSITITCYKFDTEEKAWDITDSLRLNQSQFFSFLPIPNRGILILTGSKPIYMYSGMKIEQVSEGFPFTSTSFKGSFCRTVVATDEIFVGFTQSTTLPRSINIETGVFENIKLPNLELMNSICGAFGPDGNRKVAIFGGTSFKNGKAEGNFDRTLILDWNSKKFEDHGQSLKASSFGWYGQTLSYGDTFLLYAPRNTKTDLFKFGINGNETSAHYLGTIPVRCLNVAFIQDDGC